MNTAALIGLGAMGAFFAPRLNEGLGEGNFCVIAEGERKKRLETRGVILNGETCHFPICEPKDGKPVDLVIMAVKYMGLEQAIRDIEAFVGEHTQILCVMNGVESEERLAAAYGWEHVLYSYMRISIVMKDGVADFNPNGGTVHFGEKKNPDYREAESGAAAYSDRVNEISELFRRCGIPYRIDRDMLEGLWFKYACNVGENLTCAMLGIPFGAYAVSQEANQLREAAMQEVTAVAKAKGVVIPEEKLKKQYETILKIPAKNKPSTLQDLEAGKKTEVEMFAGSMVRMGEELGIATPVCWVFLQAIHILEQKNDRVIPD